MGAVLKFIGGWKGMFIATVLISGSAFASGYYTKSQFVKAEQSKELAEALKQLEAFNALRRLDDEQQSAFERSVDGRTKETLAKLPPTDSNNPLCTDDGDTVRLLKDSLRNLPSASGDSAP